MKINTNTSNSNAERPTAACLFQRKVFANAATENMVLQ